MNLAKASCGWCRKQSATTRGCWAGCPLPFALFFSKECVVGLLLRHAGPRPCYLILYRAVIAGRVQDWTLQALDQTFQVGSTVLYLVLL